MKVIIVIVMRPYIPYFVNREKDIQRLLELIRGNSKVLILGLRGYGKTSLVVKTIEEFEKREGKICIYINCLRVYDGKDLLLEAASEFQGREKLAEELRVKSLIVRNPKEALDFLFSFSKNVGVSAIVFDEISTLINRFGLLKPFRGMGGTRAVAEFLKGLLDTYDISVILLDTSINALIELFYDYSSPLFREFDARIFIEPLGFESSLELLNILLSKRGLILNDELKLKIVEFSGGVPQYLKIISTILRSYNNEKELLEDLENELNNGLLSDYFQALLEKFPTNEQEVLFAIAKGLTRFHEIDREVINAAQALESLTKKGIVIRIEKSRKNVRYSIRDKLFATWLAIQEMPRYRRMSLRRAKLFHPGLESITREIFLTLQKEIEIEDALGEKLELCRQRM